MLDDFSEEENYNIDLRPWGLEVNQFCMFMHLALFSGVFVPFAGLALPLIMWGTNSDKSELIDRHGKSILNWIISSTIYMIASAILVFVFIGIFMLFALVICYFIFTIIGAVKASNGEVYKYPLSITFIK